MLRRWTVLAGTMVSITALTVGISMADDEEGPLHKIMEQVNKMNLAITKGVRTAVAFKKAQKDVVASAEELVKLAKQAKPIKDAVKKAKDVPDADAKWDKYLDNLVKASENLAKVAGAASATQPDVKAAHTAVKKACTDCHTVFRIEEDEDSKGEDFK
jgi:cytochrome c556